MKISISARRWLIAAAAVLAAVSLLLGTLYARGFWDENRAVHIRAGEIELSTLAIGTHLVHLSALTDSIYDIANASAEESGQNRIYYKSELGGGAWFDITTATSLHDITTAGTPVTDETMEALFFTHHTKSDKVTYDLRTGEAVNIFDIRDPYDLETLEELSPLKMYYDQTLSLEGENDVTERIDEIWKTPLTAEEIKAAEEAKRAAEKESLLKELLESLGPDAQLPEEEAAEIVVAPTDIELVDKQLAALQDYLNVLTENDADAREIEAVGGVMKAVDAGRRYAVFLVLDEALNAYMEELSGGSADEEGEGEESEGGEEDGVPPELLSALSESIGNVQSALITHGGNMLSEGVSVISSAEYTFSNELVTHAEAGNHAACDGDVQKLLLLGNVQSGTISDRVGELDLLEGDLIPAATGEYLAALHAGESAQYRAEVIKQSAQALLSRLIDENAAKVSTKRGELEFLLKAKTDRVSAVDAMAFMDARLSLTTQTFASGIPQDSFSESAAESVEEHIAFLTRLRRTLELSLGGNEMDKLTAEKADLQTQYLQALDSNDLALAKKLQEQINAVEENIRAIEDEAAAQADALRRRMEGLDEGSDEFAALQAELAVLEGSFSDGSLGVKVAQLKADALSGDADAVRALAGMLPAAPKLVLPALQDVYNDLLAKSGTGSGSGADGVDYRALADTIEQAILENPGALQEDLSVSEVQEVARQYLAEKNGKANDLAALMGAGGLSRRNEKETLAAIVGLQLYYDETGNDNVQRVLAALARELYDLGSPLVFERIDDGTGEYLPLTAIEAITQWRYVWEKNSSLGYLALGGEYYGFTVFSDRVARDRDGTLSEKMARGAQYQSCVHAPEEYTEEALGVHAVYLSGCTLGCVCDDAVMQSAQEVFAWLMRA